MTFDDFRKTMQDAQSLYVDIMRAQDLRVSIRLRGKNSQGCAHKVTSKTTGRTSLIFDPYIGLVFASANPKTAYVNIVFPSNMIYIVGNAFYKTYQKMQKEEWYLTGEDGRKETISSELPKLIGKVSGPKDEMLIVPTIIRREVDRVGVSIITRSGGNVGSLTATELESLIYTIEHFDVSTFSMIAGLMERVCSIDEKVDKILKLLEKGVHDQHGRKEEPIVELYGSDHGKALPSGGQALGFDYSGTWVQGLPEGSGLPLQLTVDQVPPSVSGPDRTGGLPTG